MNVSPDEQLTRFIRFSKHFSEPDTVRHEAFLPHKTQVDISVFRISQLFDSKELSELANASKLVVPSEETSLQS